MDSETLTTSVIISKLLVDEIGTNPVYQEVVEVADLLDLDIDQVYGFIKLYQHVQCQMII